jgi:5-methylthioadenosine/S-adenosylhomocysteine deaminase
MLHMATLGGAKALGLDHVIGSHAPGKDADVVAIDLGGVDSVPVYDPVSHLVHVAQRSDVTHVWIGGRARVQGRRLTALDEAALAQRGRAWQARLQ